MLPQMAPLQTTVSESIDQAISDAIAYLPTVVGALVVLVVGYVVGRLLGGVVTRVVRRLGIGRYAEGTAVEEMGGDGGDAIARALGRIVAYYVYFVAFVAAASILDIDALSALLADLGAFLPVVLGALVVLVVGFVVGRILGDVVAGVVGGFTIEPLLRETPLERLADETGEFGRIVGRLVTYYVYLLTLLAVADILRITALSTLLNDFSGYLPALVGGLVVLVVGIWIAERLGRLVAGTDEGRVAHLAGLGVRVLVYYLTVTVVLGTVGFDTTVLTNLFTAFVVAFFGALGLALAIGIGVAVGLGGQEFVAENIDGWASRASGAVGGGESETETGE